jgi:homoserine dehydrogenase
VVSSRIRFFVTPSTYNLCLAGFGNVGRALVRLLVDKREALREQHGIEWRITGVGSRRIRWLANAQGFAAADLLGMDTTLKGGGLKAAGTKCQDVRACLQAARADALFEMTSLNRHTGQPAIDHLLAALEHGAHAISANKGPVVYALDELSALAARAGKLFLYESAVMDGTPIFNLFRETLPAVHLRSFRGLLNSTSNVVLTEMEAGRTFDEAVRRAQEIGVAETDPTDDLEGWDPAVKVCALCNVLMGASLRPGDVERVGIASLTPEAVREARAAGRPYKLVCSARREGNAILARVAPEQLPLTDPMAQMRGTTSRLDFEMDVFGLSIIEHKPGVIATAYGLLSDLVKALRDGNHR